MPARRGARRCGFKNNPRRTLAALAVASCFSASMALANPNGMTVVNGTAVPLQAGNLLQITNSPNAIVNWQSFSIAAGEITRFVQQSAASAVLNRVTVGNPSQILGALQSNGRVFLINPSGILFGAGAQIDVAGLVASSLSLSDADFLSGRLRFTGTPGAGSVINQGAITTPSGGNVYLIGPAVANSGIITSPKGEVVLAAGNTVELVDPATPNLRVEIAAPGNEAVNLGRITAEAGRIGIYAGLINQRGTINADSVVVGENGSIVLRATKNTTLDAGSVTTASGPAGGEVTIQSGDTTMVLGTVEAKGLGFPPAGGGVAQSAGVVGAGGSVHVLGNHVGLDGNASLDASGQTGGGTVLVGGDFQGKNPEVQNAFRTYVGPETTINADAISSGDGGKVIVWADDVTRYYGSISARGGAKSGDGGFVEVSGKGSLDYRGSVAIGAPNGKGGTLLLDPTNITVVAAGGDLDGQLNGSADKTIEFGLADSTNNTLTVTALTTGFTSGDTITLQATNNIQFNTSATLQSGVNLLLEAGNNINIGTTASATVTAQGAGTLTLHADSNGPDGVGNINIGGAASTGGLVTANQAITLQGAGLSINTTNGSVNAGTSQVNIFTSQPATKPIAVGTTVVGALNLDNTTMGRITAGTLVVGDITAQEGNITIKGATPPAGKNFEAAQLKTGVGKIMLDDAGGVPLTTGAGNISLSAGTNGITANATNSTAEFSSLGTVTLISSGPIGTSTNRIQFPSTIAPVVGSVTQPAGDVFLGEFGLSALTLGTMTIGGNLDVKGASSITGNAPILVTGTSRFESTGAGDITLTDNNVFRDTVTLVTGGEVRLRQLSTTFPLKVAPFTASRAILESVAGAGSELWLSGSYESTGTDFQLFGVDIRLTGNTIITAAEGLPINANSVIGPGALQLTQSSPFSAIFLNGVPLGTSGVPLGGLTLHDASTVFGMNLGAINVNGNVDITAALDITFGNLLSASGSVTAVATGGDVGVNATLTANGTGNALTLAGTNFFNNVGTGALSTPSGRWLAYSTSPAGSTENLLTGAAGSAQPRLYNRTFAANGPGTISEPGNHLIYSTQPTLNVAANGATRAYGDANPAFTFSTSGFITDDGVTDTLANAALTGVLSTSAVTNSPVSGSPYAITQGTLISGSGYSVNYTGANLTVTPRPVTVTADAGQTKIYGNADPALAYSITTGNLVGADTLAGAAARAAGESIGAYAINQGTLANANYAITFVGNNFGITQRPITVTANAGQTKVYGNADPVFAYSITSGNLVGADALAGAAARAAGENVGAYAINQGTLANANYAIAFSANNFGITQRPITVTASAGQNKVYGNADPAFAYSISSGNLVGADTLGGALGRLAGENVGAYGINQGTLANSNYVITYAGNNFAITPAALTVTADDKTRLVGNPNPPFTASFAGFVLSESPTNLSGALAFATPAAVGSPAGSYPITPSGLSSTNYALAYVNGILLVTSAPPAPPPPPPPPFTRDLPENSALIVAVDRSGRFDDFMRDRDITIRRIGDEKQGNLNVCR